MSQTSNCLWLHGVQKLQTLAQSHKTLNSFFRSGKVIMFTLLVMSGRIDAS